MTAVVRRITLNLDARGAEAFDRLVASTGYNGTDVIHRALALYALYETGRADGIELVRRFPDGREDVIHIL